MRFFSLKSRINEYTPRKPPGAIAPGVFSWPDANRAAGSTGRDPAARRVEARTGGGLREPGRLSGGRWGEATRPPGRFCGDPRYGRGRAVRAEGSGLGEFLLAAGRGRRGRGVVL